MFASPAEDFIYDRTILLLPWCQASIDSVDLYAVFLHLQPKLPREPSFEELYGLFSFYSLLKVGDAYIVYSVSIFHIISKLS